MPTSLSCVIKHFWKNQQISTWAASEVLFIQCNSEVRCGPNSPETFRANLQLQYQMSKSVSYDKQMKHLHHYSTLKKNTIPSSSQDIPLLSWKAKFITVLTKACQWSPSHTRLLQSIPFHKICLAAFNITFTSSPRCSVSTFRIRLYTYFLWLRCVLNASPISTSL